MAAVLRTRPAVQGVKSTLGHREIWNLCSTEEVDNENGGNEHHHGGNRNAPNGGVCFASHFNVIHDDNKPLQTDRTYCCPLPVQTAADIFPCMSVRKCGIPGLGTDCGELPEAINTKLI